jgi:NAD(P)H-hydrate epimerase
MAMAAGIEGLTLMENAGRGCVQVLLDHDIQSAVICTGAGNNAGDGFVIARLLSEAGIPVKIIMSCRPEQLTGDALSNYQRIRQLSLPTMQLDERCEDSTISSALKTVDGISTDWIVDALLGTGASGNPRPPMDRLIRLANDCPARKLAVDIPSGLDCETGQPGDPTLQAELTCTFVTPKIGFRQVSARKYLGHVHVIDIGVPPGIVAAIARGADSDGTHHAG